VSSAVAISARGVSKRYRLGVARHDTLRQTLASLFSPWRGERSAGWFWALKDVDFDVPQGQAFGLIGNNGAGKSTLLKVLARITLPTEGRIEIRGRVASLLEVGTGFHMELTGRENVFLNGAILGMTRSEVRRKFDEIVAFSGVESFIDTPVKHYSSGMHVRLAFAVAAHLEPEILLVDEVLAVGDAEFQRKCLGRMDSVARSGRSVLFVSHNMQAVGALCQSAALLDRGRIVEQGDAAHVIARHLASVRVGALEQTWDQASAPAENGFQARRIAVVPRFGPDQEPLLDVTTPLDVEFEFRSDVAMPRHINLSLHLLSMSGECVFNVGSDASVVGEGVYKGVCEIPGTLLNNGIHHITMLIVKDTTTIMLTLERALTFEVADRRENGYYFGKWPGYVRPKLPFRVQALGAATPNVTPR
jgi:lipopolysaccharide transport system ATP-binding protein